MSLSACRAIRYHPRLSCFPSDKLLQGMLGLNVTSSTTSFRCYFGVSGFHQSVRNDYQKFSYVPARSIFRIVRRNVLDKNKKKMIKKAVPVEFSEWKNSSKFKFATLTAQVEMLEADNVELNREIGRLQEKLKIVKEELKGQLLMISIRSKIEFWEHMLSPGYKFVGKSTDCATYVNYHQERWIFILDNVKDPMVDNIKTFIEKEMDNDKNRFCMRIAAFFTFTSNSVHIPPLHEYKESEVEEILKNKFNLNDETILHLVHFFMKT